MNIGVNCYGIKKCMYHDFDGTFRHLADSGITFAEVCIIFPPKNECEEDLKIDKNSLEFKEITGGIWEFNEAQEKLDALKGLGIKVVSAQVMMGMTPDPEEMVENFKKFKGFAQKNNLKYVTMSLMKNMEDTRRYVPVFNWVIKELAEDNIIFAYHNHELELMDENNTTVLDYLMESCPEMKLELDVGWVQFAGKSPVEVMKKYHDRIVLLHLKDITENAGAQNRNNCFPALGEGCVPLKEILEEAKECVLGDHGIIIDQDNSFGNILDDLVLGVKNIKAICGKA